MNLRRILSVVVVAALVALGAADAGFAKKQLPECGKGVDPDTGEPPTAVLVLTTDSVTSHNFKRDTEPAPLSLIFTVSGCKLPDDLELSPVEVLPAKDVDSFPQGAVTSTSIDVNGPELTANLEVKPSTFDPGSYGGLVRLRAPKHLAPNRTPIAASRTEDQLWIPGLAIAFGAAIGLAGLLIVKFIPGELTIGGRKLVLACVFVLVAAFGAAVPNYLNQDVWTLGSNGWATFLAALAAAGAGSGAALFSATKKDGGG